MSDLVLTPQGQCIFSENRTKGFRWRNVNTGEYGEVKFDQDDTPIFIKGNAERTQRTD